MKNLTLKKETITSLELLEQINFFRKEEGNRAELGHNVLLKVIRDEFEEEISLEKIFQSNYISPRGKEYPMFELTLAQAKQVLIRESKHVRKKVIAYIEALENEIKKITSLNREQELVLTIYAGGISSIEAAKELMDLKIKPLEQEIEYKEDVIIALTDKIELSEQRQILNKVVRMGGNQFKERWDLLYKEFNSKYHINLKRRLAGYNKKNGTKLSKLDYVEKILDKLPELYNIACKLFEGDVEKIISEYRIVCE
jgi:hypothetical protein